MHMRRWVLLVASPILFAGCGGGSSGSAHDGGGVPNGASDGGTEAVGSATLRANVKVLEAGQVSSKTADAWVVPVSVGVRASDVLLLDTEAGRGTAGEEEGGGGPPPGAAPPGEGGVFQGGPENPAPLPGGR